MDGEGWGGRARCRGGANGHLARPGSLVLFGSCTICLNVFRVGYDVSHIHCKSQLELIFPVIEIIFIGVQVTDCPPPHAACTHSLPVPGNHHAGKHIRGRGDAHTYHSPPLLPASTHPHPRTPTRVCLHQHSQRVTDMQTPVDTSTRAYWRMTKSTHPAQVHRATTTRVPESLSRAGHHASHFFASSFPSPQ